MLHQQARIVEDHSVSEAQGRYLRVNEEDHKGRIKLPPCGPFQRGEVRTSSLTVLPA